MSVHIPPCKDCICFAVCKSKYSEALKTDEPKTVVFATMQVEYDCPLLTNHLAEITRQERGKKEYSIISCIHNVIKEIFGE